jgi:hypothetical protein
MSDSHLQPRLFEGYFRWSGYCSGADYGCFSVMLVGVS